jgi:site-specific recombinase XerD
MRDSFFKNVNTVGAIDDCTIRFTEVNNVNAVRRLIRLIAKEVRRNRLDYGTLRYIYREVRRNCDLVVPRQPKKLVELYTQNEIYRFFSVIEDPVHKLIFEVLLGTGARVSELVSIEVSKINFQANTIHIVGKGRKERLILFSRRLGDQLKIYLANRPNRYLFTSSRHDKFGTRRIQQMFSEYKRLAKIDKPGNVHQLRHQYFSRICDAGISREHRMLLGGHSQSKTQDLYSKASLGAVSPQLLKTLEELGL